MDFALYIQHLVEQTSSASAINSAFYAINWVHKLAGLESPTNRPTVLLIKEGAIRMCSQKCNRKEPLEPVHLKDLASQTNFEDLLQLRSLAMYVLSFSGFLRSAEILELRRNDIVYQRRTCADWPKTATFFCEERSLPSNYSISDEKPIYSRKIVQKICLR